MSSPCDPLTPRQELISELEGYGFDFAAAADWPMSDADLSLTAAAWRDDSGFPETAEIVATMREVVDAAEAYTDADTPENEQRCHAALDRQKDLLSRITKAQEA
ncbi:hypothetical protein [Mesorhizobium sp. M0522]|uniref:hypothetical protein n=1 Tax=Mesorhizobium sp. M0522 TaxID=2956958 RepID=UPI003334B8A2